MTPALLLVIGYAIGTAQILLLDWARRRIQHAQHLRLLRAELLRNAAFTRKYNLPQEGPLPTDQESPRWPPLAEGFQTPVAQIDFYITDEYDGDNCQEGLLSLLDAATLLRHYGQEIFKEGETFRKPDVDGSHDTAEDRVRALARHYDGTVDIFAANQKAAFADIERRLAIAHLWPQAKRPIGRLPKGTPPSLPSR